MSDLIFKEAASPVMWLLTGHVQVGDNTCSYWYQYDERDGEVLYEFETDPEDFEPDFDYEGFADKCQAQLEKSWTIVHHLNNVEVTDEQL